ncbi:MAG: 50S ribosomal protein L25 [Patescibacteria group bacterium]
MAKEIKLNAQTRNKKNDKAKKIRTNDYIPAVVYGAGFDNANIKIKRNEFKHAFCLAGESNLIDLSIDDQKSIKVIVKDTQKDNVRNNVIHIDFYQINMNKQITTEIPLNFIGESSVVKELGGTIVKNINSLKVECLPGDLVDHIDVDLSKLKTFADLIYLNDIKLPHGITLISHTNEAVVSVSEVAKEEEVKQPIADVAPETKSKETATTAVEATENKDKKENKK